MKTAVLLSLVLSSLVLVEASFLDRLLFRQERQVDSNVNNGMLIGNNTTDPYEPQVTTEPPRRGHHGIHVASWNWAYVRPYLITTFFLVIVAICKLGFHKAETLASIVPESCLLVVLGTIVGAILYGIKIDPERFHLTSELFFLILLPPIILESAYSLHDRVFFFNLGTVLLYAVIGTILNCALLGLALYGLAISGAMGAISITILQCLVFSSLIVAVDPVAVLAIFQEIGVNNVLYFLVFGESLLNDAVTVVIYNTMKTFDLMDSIPPAQYGLAIAAFFSVSLGGLSIGIIIGIFSSILTKYTHDVRVVEPLAIFTLAYGAYIVAELFHFSGIISIIGCGLVQAQYAFHNISMKSLTTVTYFSKTISTTSDCVIFMFLGMALVRDNHVWHTGFILWTLLLCLVFRFIIVISLTFIANFFRVRKIDMEEQFIMAYGGLRGAVAFSLVVMLESKNMPHKALFVTTTLAVIISTVFIQGITIKPLVNLFRIRKSGTKVASMYQEINAHATDYLMAAVEEIIGSRGENTAREWLIYYDNKYLKKWLQRNPQTRENAIMQLHQQMTMQLHYENLQKGGPEKFKIESFIYDNDGDLDMYPLPPELEKIAEAEDELEENYVRSIIEAKEEDYIMQSKRKSVQDHRMRSLTMPQMSLRRKLLTRSRASQAIERHSHVGHEGHVDIRGSRRPSLPEMDVGHLRKAFVKNPNIYRQRHDKNLKRDEDNDLLHILYEKRRRTARMLSMTSSRTSSVISGDRESGYSRGASPLPDQPVRRNTLDVIKETNGSSSSDDSNNNNQGRAVRRNVSGRGFLKTKSPRTARKPNPTDKEHVEMSQQATPEVTIRAPLLATNVPISDQPDNSDTQSSENLPRRTDQQRSGSRDDVSQPIIIRGPKSSADDVSESNV